MNVRCEVCAHVGRSICVGRRQSVRKAQFPAGRLVSIPCADGLLCVDDRWDGDDQIANHSPGAVVGRDFDVHCQRVLDRIITWIEDFVSDVAVRRKLELHVVKQGTAVVGGVILVDGLRHIVERAGSDKVRAGERLPGCVLDHRSAGAGGESDRQYAGCACDEV